MLYFQVQFIAMKRRLHLLSCLVLVCSSITLFWACGKNNDTTPDAPNSFTWGFMGTGYVATQDTAFTSGLGMQPFVIYAGRGTNYLTYTSRFYFNLASFNPGTYTFSTGPSAPNFFQYIHEDGFTWGGTGGTLTINTNSNGKMSGSFVATVNGPGGTQSISGSFINMPVKP